MRRSASLTSWAPSRACRARPWSKSSPSFRSGRGWSSFPFSGAYRFSVARARSASPRSSRARSSPLASSRDTLSRRCWSSSRPEASPSSEGSTPASLTSTHPMRWRVRRMVSRSSAMAINRRRFIFMMAISDSQPFLRLRGRPGPAGSELSASTAHSLIWPVPVPSG